MVPESKELVGSFLVEFFNRKVTLKFLFYIINNILFLFQNRTKSMASKEKSSFFIGFGEKKVLIKH